MIMVMIPAQTGTLDLVSPFLFSAFIPILLGVTPIIIQALPSM